MEYLSEICKEFRKASALALYSNILWWAKGNHEVDEKTLDMAFMVLDNIILKDFEKEFVVTLPQNTILYRARNIEPNDYTEREKGISYSNNRLYGYNWKESKEPPENYANEGRTSRKGNSALYLADDEITACMEVRTKIKQLVSVAQFELQKEIKVIDFSKLQYSQPLDKYDEKYDVDVRDFLGRIFALFTYPVYDGNYIVTQKIVEHFRDYGFKGIAYRSLYTGKANYTFFDEYRGLFVWKESRVLINYAVANLFVSMDEIEGHNDISNQEQLKKEISETTRKQMLKNTKDLFTNGAEV